MCRKTLQNFDIQLFQENLLHWYEENKRDLPWRKDQDPYKIWVSEVMLQQTRVDTVIPYFNRFITDYPTVHDLAVADEQEVLKAWEGLGYYSRARNLQHAVREVVASYDGIVPETPKELGSLKGIGPYTRGAILSIAFDQPEPAVDGNVMRVLSRILKIEDNISEHKVRRQFEELVREVIPERDPASFNQGMMELGALICIPKAPKCLECPIQKQCRAHAAGVEKQLPIKAKAKKQTVIHYVALLIKNDQGEYIIEQRPSKGLLANLWQFPMIPMNETADKDIEKWMEENYGLTITLGEKRGKLKHVFTHLIWNIDIYIAETRQEKAKENDWQFIKKRELRAFPFPVSHLNMMKFLPKG